MLWVLLLLLLFVGSIELNIVVIVMVVCVFFTTVEPSDEEKNEPHTHMERFTYIRIITACFRRALTMKMSEHNGNEKASVTF